MPDLAGENARLLLPYVFDPLLEVRGRYPGLGAADDSGPDAARFLVPVEDLRDAAVRDAQLTRDDAGPDARGCHLDDLQPDMIRQRSTVYEHPAELVHPALTWNVT